MRKVLLPVVCLLFIGSIAVAQGPQTNGEKPALPMPVAAKFAPLTEIERLTLENLQLQAALSLRELEASEPYKLYASRMAALGKKTQAVIDTYETANRCGTIDTATRQPVAKKDCK